MALPLLLKIDEVVEQTGLSLRKVKGLLASGEIESVRIGRSRRIPADALTVYVARLRGLSPRETYLQKVVDSIPPITAEQRALITGLLSPAADVAPPTQTGPPDAA